METFVGLEQLVEHLDVIIVGAGLSGVGAACRLRMECPGKSFVILEGRGAIGGTWDLFRYPGVRSDSDMFTLGYRFRPWRESKVMADAPAILNYIRETAVEHGVDKAIRFNHRVRRASWSSDDARWIVEVETGPEKAAENGRGNAGNASDSSSARNASDASDSGNARNSRNASDASDAGNATDASNRAQQDKTIVQFTCNFLYLCTGYYDYQNGYTPEWPGVESFKGTIVHPQKWPEGLDYTNKRVVVIGSGATAVTLVPAMAERAAHVTMLQRSPSYIVSRPAEDSVANLLRRFLPDRSAYVMSRWKNVLAATFFYNLARKRPEFFKWMVARGVRKQLQTEYNAKHFTPRYNPWDQRMCFVPDGDLFINALGVQLLGFGRFQDVRVVLAAGNGFLKNRRVRGHPHQAVFLNHFLQAAAGEQVSADVVHPRGLAVFQQRLQRVYALGSDTRKRCCSCHEVLLCCWGAYLLLYAAASRLARAPNPAGALDLSGAGVFCFDGFYLAKAADMPLLIREFRAQVSLYQIVCQHDADHPRA